MAGWRHSSRLRRNGQGLQECAGWDHPWGWVSTAAIPAHRAQRPACPPATLCQHLAPLHAEPWGSLSFGLPAAPFTSRSPGAECNDIPEPGGMGWDTPHCCKGLPGRHQGTQPCSTHSAGLLSNVTNPHQPLPRPTPARWETTEAHTSFPFPSSGLIHGLFVQWNKLLPNRDLVPGPSQRESQVKPLRVGSEQVQTVSTGLSCCSNL